jgi:hypothetical protein
MLLFCRCPCPCIGVSSGTLWLVGPKNHTFSLSFNKNSSLVGSLVEALASEDSSKLSIREPHYGLQCLFDPAFVVLYFPRMQLRCGIRLLGQLLLLLKESASSSSSHLKKYRTTTVRLRHRVVVPTFNCAWQQGVDRTRPEISSSCRHIQ